MTTIQRNLLPAYYNDKLLCDKLINACRENEVCKFACYKASNILIGVISDLQSSITTYERPKQLGAYIANYNLHFDPDNDYDPEAYYTDRKYQGQSRFPPKFKSR